VTQISEIVREIESIVERYNLDPVLAAIVLNRVADVQLAQVECPLDDLDDREIEYDVVHAGLDPEIDIRDLGAIEVIIHHSLGEDSVWLERDETGVWCAPHDTVTTLPQEYVMDNPDDTGPESS
jgi:hypothetical protein